MLEKSGAPPRSPNDGVCHRQEIELDDPTRRSAPAVVRRSPRRTDDVAGDGTTPATVLAQALVREACAMSPPGANPMALKRGIEKGRRRCLRRTLGPGRSVGRQTIGEMMPSHRRDRVDLGRRPRGIGKSYRHRRAMDKVGKEGVITVEGQAPCRPSAPSLRNPADRGHALRLRGGPISPYFVTDPSAITGHVAVTRIPTTAKLAWPSVITRSTIGTVIRTCCPWRRPARSCRAAKPLVDHRRGRRRRNHRPCRPGPVNKIRLFGIFRIRRRQGSRLATAGKAMLALLTSPSSPVALGSSPSGGRSPVQAREPGPRSDLLGPCALQGRRHQDTPRSSGVPVTRTQIGSRCPVIRRDRSRTTATATAKLQERLGQVLAGGVAVIKAGAATEVGSSGAQAPHRTPCAMRLGGENMALPSIGPRASSLVVVARSSRPAGPEGPSQKARPVGRGPSAPTSSGQLALDAPVPRSPSTPGGTGVVAEGPPKVGLATVSTRATA